MQAEILAGLDPALQALVAEIEKAAGFQIEVRSRHAREGDVQEDLSEDNTVGAIPWVDSAIIEYPNSPDDLTHEAMAHELLHLRRTYVERVPHLYARSKADGSAAAAIENMIEHVIIYERQMKLCPGLESILDKQLREFWSKFPLGLSGQQLRFNALTRYMVTHRFCSTAIRKQMSETLARHPQQFNLRQESRRILRLVDNKRAYTRAVLDFCQIPKEKFWLRWFDLQERKPQWNAV